MKGDYEIVDVLMCAGFVGCNVYRKRIMEVLSRYNGGLDYGVLVDSVGVGVENYGLFDECVFSLIGEGLVEELDEGVFKLSEFGMIVFNKV